MDTVSRPEATWVRERVQDALREAGLHLWGEQLETALTNAALLLMLEDRATSAQLVHEALATYGPLDADQTSRLADVIQFRKEPEPGIIELEFSED